MCSMSNLIFRQSSVDGKIVNKKVFDMSNFQAFLLIGKEKIV